MAILVVCINSIQNPKMTRKKMKNKRQVCIQSVLIILSLLLMNGVSGFAQQGQAVEKMDDLVVTSTKMGQNPEHMTGSVTVISREEIKRQSFTDMTEILRFTPSVEFKQAGGPGHFSYPKMRGMARGIFLFW